MSKKRQSAMIEHTLQEICGRNNEAGLRRKPYVLALLTSHMIGMESGFSYLKMLKEEDIIIRLSAEEGVMDRYSQQELVRVTGNDDWIFHKILSEKLIRDLDAVFLPILSFSLVSDILAFNDQRPFVRIIMKALLEGKKVIGLKIGADPFHPLWKMKGIDKGPDLLKRKLYENMLQLKSLGIKLIDEDEKADFSILKIRKTVVTEETIRYAHQQKQSKLIIKKDAIITPLAKDTAKELNIALILQ